MPGLHQPMLNSVNLHTRRKRNRQEKCKANDALYGVQSLEYISLQILKGFTSEAKPHQVILYPILEPLLLAQIPVSNILSYNYKQVLKQIYYGFHYIIKE